jgi:hypothetical protein
MDREHIACSSLLRLIEAVLADPGPMPARLVRGCIALAFTACAPALNHRLADTVNKGGELRYTTLAMEREHIASSSLLTLTRTVVADPEPMTACLVRGSFPLAFTPRVHAVSRSHRLAEVMPSRAARSATWR